MEIEKNDFNLYISRHISTAQCEKHIDLMATSQALLKIENDIRKTRETHDGFQLELGPPPLQTGS